MEQNVSIDDLHPTQLTLGMAEVRRRAQAMNKLAPGDLKALLLNKAIPHVLGPERQIYMVDHHHLCRALLEIGREKVILGAQLADLSALNQQEFWLQMEARNFCWPIDVNGDRRPYSRIPDHVRDLTDNPWRTLARSVRGQAYTNEDTPFQEFKWGDYYRSFMSRRLLECDVALATEMAVKLSQIDEAQDLPGYIAKV
ncbi:ParB-like protein [Xanthobacter sp. TB0139]|uniref:ParB-like protein n=1 Tax=Xanthobacter sp. TB0139 TaxID=3459178 RepID=UPI00403A4EB8